MVCLLSCGPSDTKTYNTGIGLRVEIPMGVLDMNNAQQTKINLPYIGNKAVIPNLNDDELEFLILSESLKKNMFIQTFPIAVLRLKVFGNPKNIVISMPTDSVEGTFRINNFMEFVSEYYFLKQNLENWYLNRYGLGNTQLVSWEDEKFALNLINRKLMQNG